MEEFLQEIVSHPGACIVALNEKRNIDGKTVQETVDEILIEIPARKIRDKQDINACAQRN